MIKIPYPFSATKKFERLLTIPDQWLQTERDRGTTQRTQLWREALHGVQSTIHAGDYSTSHTEISAHFPWNINIIECVYVFQAKISNHRAWIYLLSLPLIKLVFANCVTYHRCTLSCKLGKMVNDGQIAHQIPACLLWWYFIVTIIFMFSLLVLYWPRESILTPFFTKEQSVSTFPSFIM